MIEGFELRRVRLPLVTPFRTSTGVQHERDALLVCVHTDTADGWGECVAMSEPHYSPEYVDGAAHVIAEFLLPVVRSAHDADIEGPNGLGFAMRHVKGHPMAKAAIETAVLDAHLRASGTSLATFLGATRMRVPAGVSIGIMGSIAELIDAVAAYVAEGYGRIKLKIAPGNDVEPVAAVRDRFPEVGLQVDANGAYTLADADHLGLLDAFDLLLIEQPLDDDDVFGHAALAARLSTPICLDESIVSVRSAAQAIEAGACSVINLKPGRVGGYLEARRIHDLCVDAGVGLWCGGMLETGIGRAANLALAALPGFTLTGDLSASDRYFREDITAPFVLIDGHLLVPDGPGIGVAPEPAALALVTTSTRWLPLLTSSQD